MRSLVVSAVVCALAAPAAASEGQSALSASLGVGDWFLPVGDDQVGPTVGGVLGISYERDLSERLAWRIEAAGGVYVGGGLSVGGQGGASLVYRLDVLKYVPYAAVGVGGVLLAGGDAPELTLAPAGLACLGLDVLQSRVRSWGVEARLATLPGEATTVTVAVRLTTRWGFF